MKKTQPKAPKAVSHDVRRLGIRIREHRKARGMTMVEVRQILGGPGEVYAPSGVGISAGGIVGGNSSSQNIYVWKSKSKEITVTFDKNDKVIQAMKAGF